VRLGRRRGPDGLVHIDDPTRTHKGTAQVFVRCERDRSVGFVPSYLYTEVPGTEAVTCIRCLGWRRERWQPPG